MNTRKLLWGLIAAVVTLTVVVTLMARFNTEVIDFLGLDHATALFLFLIAGAIACLVCGAIIAARGSR